MDKIIDLAHVLGYIIIIIESLVNDWFLAHCLNILFTVIGGNDVYGCITD